MAIMKGGGYVEGRPKKSRQGAGKHTKLSATSRDGAKKRYRGQGRCIESNHTLFVLKKPIASRTNHTKVCRKIQVFTYPDHDTFSWHRYEKSRII